MGHSHKHRKDPKMSTLEELESLYTAGDIPINPVNGLDKPEGKRGQGWKFYQKIRVYLVEWWEEFNGAQDSHGRLKYDTIRGFIKTKTHSKTERDYLHQMIGPVYTRHDDTDVPWLGDWEKRREAGFGVLDNPGKIKPLIKIIQNNVAAAESIRSLTPILVEDLVQYSNLQKQVHKAFAGKAFNSGKADGLQNRSRLKAYQTMLWALSKLKIKIVHEIMRVHGVDPNLPNQMRDMAQIAGGIGAAAALTGIAAGQRIPGLGVGTGDGSIAPYTYDAIKLATHLTRHAHTFKKPLPIIEGEEAEHDSDSSSSKRSNGRTQ